MGIIHESLVSPQEPASEYANRQLSSFKQIFNNELQIFLQNEMNRVDLIRPEATQILADGIEFALREGKRLRPAFMYFSYVGFNGDGNDEVLKSSIALELFHAGALVLDDIIDHSDLRRNKPTLHKLVGQRLNNSDLGEGIGIVAGNVLITLAGSALSSLSIDSQRAQNARTIYDQMSVEVNYGQYLDLLGNISEETDEDLVMKIMEYKTARYTIQKPLLIGATLAGASDADLAALSKYAIPLGIAFQIKDDILGMYGNERKVGKPTDSDLKEGKKTILTVETIKVLSETSREDDLVRFKSILGNPNLTPDDYLWAQDIIKETGALDYANQLISNLTEAAKANIAELSANTNFKTFLTGIADLMINRET